jgi:alpha-amylase/alpha-mannosidase (GH57 family)
MSDRRKAKPLQDWPLRVVICWHMHQPEYRDLVSGEYQLPWTYLHTIKDYIDMAAHLEAVPAARVVVNFAPILLEQIDDYAARIRRFLDDGTPLSDPLLAALVEPVLPAHPERRLELIHACLKVNRHRVVNRFPAYARLADIADLFSNDCEETVYLSDQFIADMLVWYHLGWLGETVRRSDLRVQRLQDKGQNYSIHERRELLALIGELIDGVLARYAALARRGQVELSMTPYAHPIVPLLLDLKSAREAMPGVDLPQASSYPGGLDCAGRHMEEGLAVFERHFGMRPSGCWPSEGSVSTAALELIENYDFKWAATGESVLRHSLQASKQDAEAHDAVLSGYRLSGNRLVCFFRDDQLSDEIGFTYHDWHADDAVANMVHRLEQTAATAAGHKAVVPIILDGENAWEHYPENAYYFLRALFEQLSASSALNMTTFSECLEAGVQVKSLRRLVAGSWVYGTFSTWIGDVDKNRGWDMLVDAKKTYDRVIASGALSDDEAQLAQRQLAVCEGSDWFWWFGDYNPAATVSDFECLFRRHLTNLYRVLNVEPPEYLAHTFARGSGDPSLGGVMRHGRKLD